MKIIGFMSVEIFSLRLEVQGRGEEEIPARRTRLVCLIHH